MMQTIRLKDNAELAGNGHLFNDDDIVWVKVTNNRWSYFDTFIERSKQCVR